MRVSAVIAALKRFVHRHGTSVVVALAAIAVVDQFLLATLQRTELGLPLDDGYIYLSYAKQFGRAEPFSYYPGGGYSAGATSILWPMLLAPFWTLGARGHALVWVSFFMCAALYVITCVGCNVLAKRLFGPVAGVVAGILAVAVAPFAWTALAGMEVALASALLVLALYQLAFHDLERPRWRLVVTLAALSVSRPEAMLLVAGIVVWCVVWRLWARDWRAAVRWALPMVAPALWMIANRALAGQWMPNTGVAKSHFYLPGFDWAYWWETVETQAAAAKEALFEKETTPLLWPRVIYWMWIVGAVRVLEYFWREKRVIVGLAFVGAPFVLIVGVIASSGAWAFHNYRYIAPAFPIIMMTAACAVGLPRPWRTSTALAARIARGVHIAAAVVFLGLFARAAIHPLRVDITLYVQTVEDLNRQVVKLGRYLHDKLPDARVMYHDAGAIAYYGDTEVYDMLGLVTNRQAGVANNGPGARFEFLESLRPEERPTHFAYYPDWMGTTEFFAERLLRTPLGAAFHNKRLVGGGDMHLIVARWDAVHTAERPLRGTRGWDLVDRVDVADMRSEQAHGWYGALGQRKWGDPTARWSLVHKDTSNGLAIDGGRTIRGRRERFHVTADPARPLRLVMRTGGAAGYPWQDPIRAPVEITLVVNGAPLAPRTIAAPLGPFVEVTFDVPPTGTRDNVVEVRGSGIYRVFHWFVLQPPG